jgi:hypothetical protein
MDDLVKSRKCILFVIPAKAGIQSSQTLKNTWTPFFNGVTIFYEIIKMKLPRKLYEKGVPLSMIGNGWIDGTGDISFTFRA